MMEQPLGQGRMERDARAGQEVEVVVDCQGGLLVRPVSDTADLLEEGRSLASRRDDLIAYGIDPALLLVPEAPVEVEEGHEHQPKIFRGLFGTHVKCVLCGQRLRKDG